MIKILHISITSDIGGGPEHIKQLIGGLSDQIECHIACPIDGPYFKYFEELTNKRYVSLTNRKFKIKDFIDVYKYIKKNKINIVHTHGKGAGVYGKLLKLFINYILIHTPHGINQNIEIGISNQFYLKFERKLKFLNNCIIYVSQSEYQYALKMKLWDSCKSVIIYNGTKNFLNKNLKNRKFIKNNDESKIIITTSRFDFQKNTIEFCKISKNLPQYKFVILGDGVEKENCISYCNQNKIKNIEFKGFVNNPLNFIEAADLYLSTARWEGLSMSILEAMSVGLPIIATNVIGNKDLVFNNKNGFLYELGNFDEATEYIKIIFTEKNYENFSIESLNIHSNNFSSNIMCKKTEDLYKSYFNL